MTLKHLSEYRNGDLCRRILDDLHSASRTPVRLMEVCGTHTMSISRYGLRELLPETVTLLSGPGCPVCVTSQGEIDQCVALVRREGLIITTFGDLLRVPGSTSSLEMERSKGSDVRIVLSSMDSLQIAASRPERDVVFLGIGFETTAPTIAATILEADRRGLTNFAVLCAHKLIPPALDVLMLNPKVQIDGFICPGHVSVIIGAKAFRSVAETFHVPCVISGFEPTDILHSIRMLVGQIEKGVAEVEIEYTRSVTVDGNRKAREILCSVFEPGDALWRGLGLIPRSGLQLRDTFKAFDARWKYDLSLEEAEEPEGCICGEILCGIKTPADCSIFGATCTPDHPVGPCMVSSEGTCAAYFKYGR